MCFCDRKMTVIIWLLRLPKCIFTLQIQKKFFNKRYVFVVENENYGNFNNSLTMFAKKIYF